MKSFHKRGPTPQKKTEREFQPYWLKQFSWLEYKSSSAGAGIAAHAGVGGAADRRGDDADRHDDDAVLSMSMFCKYCCKYEKAGSFVVGSPVFKLESIKAHNSSASHMKWALREKAESNPGSNVADKTMDQLGKTTFYKMCKLFRNAHAIARHSRPYTDFVWMCTLDDMKGVQIGNTYRNDKQCATFIHHIAQAQRDEIKQMAAEAKFVSLSCDGSTDNSHTEAKLAYVRFCHQGSISVHFVGVKSDRSGNVNFLYRLLCWPLVGKEDCGKWN